MPLRDINEEISYTYRCIQEETNEILRVLRGMTFIDYLCGDAFISGIKYMLLCEIEEVISYNYTDCQEENDEIYRVLRGMTKIAYFSGDTFISGVK